MEHARMSMSHVDTGLSPGAWGLLTPPGYAGMDRLRRMSGEIWRDL